MLAPNLFAFHNVTCCPAHSYPCSSTWAIQFAPTTTLPPITTLGPKLDHVQLSGLGPQLINEIQSPEKIVALLARGAPVDFKVR